MKVLRAGVWWERGMEATFPSAKHAVRDLLYSMQAGGHKAANLWFGQQILSEKRTASGYQKYSSWEFWDNSHRSKGTKTASAACCLLSCHCPALKKAQHHPFDSHTSRIHKHWSEALSLFSSPGWKAPGLSVYFCSDLCACRTSTSLCPFLICSLCTCRPLSMAVTNSFACTKICLLLLMSLSSHVPHKILCHLMYLFNNEFLSSYLFSLSLLCSCHHTRQCCFCSICSLLTFEICSIFLICKAIKSVSMFGTWISNFFILKLNYRTENLTALYKAVF